MRGSPITYNAVDGNYWRDRVDVVNGEKLVVLACRRGYQYWPLDGAAPQLLLDEPGAPHPERSAFGDQDESKWRDGPNGPTDPYVEIWALFCANPDTGAEATFVTPTAGGFIAVEVLVKDILKKRRREPDAYPLVKLEDAPFKTRYGVKKRPHFAVVDWVFPGGEREPERSAPEPPESRRLRQYRRRQRKRLSLRRSRAAERRLRLARRRLRPSHPASIPSTTFRSTSEFCPQVEARLDFHRVGFRQGNPRRCLRQPRSPRSASSSAAPASTLFRPTAKGRLSANGRR